MRHAKIIAPILMSFLTALFANAFAQDAAGGKTREQVKAELKEAQRTGNMPCGDESGRTLREANPSRYPAPPATVGKTREQVKAELEEAKRTGDVMCANESGMKEREANPGRYPAKPSGPTKSRAQVKAELEEAKRLGNIPAVARPA